MDHEPLTSSTDHFACSAQILAILPESLGRMAQLIGIDNTLAMVDRFGGTSVYIPTVDRCSEDHELADIIGYFELRKLAMEHGPRRLEIPLAHAMMRRIRDMRIHDLARHMTHKSIARRFRMTERTVRNICAQSTNAPAIKQRDLFD